MRNLNLLNGYRQTGPEIVKTFGEVGDHGKFTRDSAWRRPAWPGAAWQSEARQQGSSFGAAPSLCEAV